MSYPKRLQLTVRPTITIATIDISLIRILRLGPDVSLNGSPTISPTTAALCTSLPFPPRYPNNAFMQTNYTIYAVKQKSRQSSVDSACFYRCKSQIEKTDISLFNNQLEYAGIVSGIYLQQIHSRSKTGSRYAR